MRSLALLLVAGCGRVAFDPLSDAASTMRDDTGGDTTTGAPVRIASKHQLGAIMTVSPNVAALPTPVDPARTLVLCDFRTLDSGAANMPTCEISSSTTITFTTGRTDNALVVSAQVIEFSGPVRVQCGIESFTTADQVKDIAIQSTALSKSFAVVSRRSDYAFNDGDGKFAVTAELITPTTLRLARSALGSGSLDVAWQVIEIEGASVQAGMTNIAVGATTGSSTIAAIDTASTFLVSSYRTDADVEGEYLARVELASASAITATVNVPSSNGMDVAWYAVSVPQLRVQRGGVATTNQSLVGATFASVVESRSFVVSTVSGGLSGDNSAFDATMCTTTLNGPTNLVAERGMATSVNGAVSWTVVEWPP